MIHLRLPIFLSSNFEVQPKAKAKILASPKSKPAAKKVTKIANKGKKGTKVTIPCAKHKCAKEKKGVAKAKAKPDREGCRKNTRKPATRARVYSSIYHFETSRGKSKEQAATLAREECDRMGLYSKKA